jgi:DNA-binding transcriptional LysR family regulator
VLVVAAQRSLRRAAAALQVSQVALEARLRRIEQAVGGPLFARAGDAVWPSELGSHFVTGARDVTDRFDALRRRAAELAAPGEPELCRIAAVPAELLTDLMDAVQAVWPGQRLSVRQGSPTEALAALSGDGADLAVVVDCPGAEALPPDGVEARPIVTGEPVLVVLPENHPLAGRSDLDLAELAGADWIVTAPSDHGGLGGLYASLRAACALAGFVPATRHEAAEPAAIAHLIRTGGGIGLAGPLSPPSTGVVHRPLRGTPLTRDLVLCWRARSAVAAHADVLHAHLVHAYHRRIDGPAEN